MKIHDYKIRKQIEIFYLYNSIPNVSKTTNIIPPGATDFRSRFSDVTHGNWKEFMHCQGKIFLE